MSSSATALLHKTVKELQKFVSILETIGYTALAKLVANLLRTFQEYVTIRFQQKVNPLMDNVFRPLHELLIKYSSILGHFSGAVKPVAKGGRTTPSSNSARSTF